MIKIALLLLSAAALLAQGTKDLSPRYLGAYTVSTLPSAASWSGYVAVVTDALTAGSCTSGSGSALALCRSSGSVWATLGGASGAGGLTYTPVRNGTTTILDLPAITTGTMAVGTLACGAVGTATVTASSGTGTVWVALASDCTVVARHNIVAACSANCTAVASSSGFDPTDLPLYQWTVTSGVFAATGTNKLLPNASKPLVAGANVVLAESAGVTTISAAAASGLNPIVKEEFSPTLAGVGQYVWELGGTSPTIASIASEAGHYGISRLSSSSGNSASIDMLSGGALPPVFDLFGETGWTREFEFRPNTTGAIVQAGFFSDRSFTNYVRANGTVDSGNVLFEFCAASCGGGISSVSSGVPVVAADWVVVKLRSAVVGTILASISINGGAFSTEKSMCASGCDASGTVTSVATTPYFFTYKAGATTNADIDSYIHY